MGWENRIALAPFFPQRLTMLTRALSAALSAMAPPDATANTRSRPADWKSFDQPIDGSGVLRV
jgi:hypothetical protein